VFAESEVISQLAAGQDLASVAAGIVTSIGGRTATLARRVGVREQVCMSGGVARSQAVRDAVGKALGTQLLYSPFAQCFGALGAALYALRRAPKPADAPEDAWRRSQLAGPTELPLPGRRPASPEKE
jgi:activator of 2-hydroxyglutaryl-CoA dehydratase